MIFDRTNYILTDTPLKKTLLRLFQKELTLTILDIGGCEGEESIRYSRLFPNATIYIFEPLPSNQMLITKNLKAYNVTNVQLVSVALSDQDGNAEFHVSSGHPKEQLKDLDWNFGNKSSSLLEPGSVGINKWLEFKEKITVATMTINSFLEQNGLDNIDFVHMDVQGAELKVLKGAGVNLKIIKAIWLEVADISIYKDQVLRSDIEVFMKSNDFVLVKTEMQGLSGDQLYINKNHIGLLSLFFYKVKKFFYK